MRILRGLGALTLALCWQFSASASQATPCPEEVCVDLNVSRVQLVFRQAADHIPFLIELPDKPSAPQAVRLTLYRGYKCRHRKPSRELQCEGFEYVYDRVIELRHKSRSFYLDPTRPWLKFGYYVLKGSLVSPEATDQLPRARQVAIPSHSSDWSPLLALKE